MKVLAYKADKRKWICLIEYCIGGRRFCFLTQVKSLNKTEVENEHYIHRFAGIQVAVFNYYM